MRQLRIGDRAVVRSELQLGGIYEGNGENPHVRSEVTVGGSHMRWAPPRSTVTIDKVTWGNSDNPNFYTIKEDGGRNPWSDSMFEPCLDVPTIVILY